MRAPTITTTMRGLGLGWETWLGWLDVRDYGGGPNRSAAENANAIQWAIYVAQNEGGGIVFFRPGEYLTDTQLNVTGGVSLWGPGAIIKQADGADQTAVIDIDVVGYDSLFLNIGVDGNMANNTAIEGIVIKDLNLAHHDVNVYAKNCDIGVVVEGNTESAIIFTTTVNCDIGVVEREVAGQQPDEVTIFINGKSNVTHYKKESSGTQITSVLHFSCEQSTGYAVILDGGLTTINGEIRGCQDGGIDLLDGSAIFNNPMLYGTGTEWGLRADADSNAISGSIRMSAFDGGGWIRGCDFGSLHITARSCGTLPAIKLGDFAGGTQARRFTVLPGSNGLSDSGPVVLFDKSYSCVVNMNFISTPGATDVEFGEGSNRDLLRIPGEYNGIATTVHASAANPAIETYGQNTPPSFADVDATPSILMGTVFNSGNAVETITDFTDKARGKEFTIISKDTITYDVTATNLKGGTVDIVTNTGDITRWICDGDDTVRLMAFVDMNVDNSAGA